MFVLVETDVKEEYILRPSESNGCTLCEAAMADVDKLRTKYGTEFFPNELSTSEFMKCVTVRVSLGEFIFRSVSTIQSRRIIW
jgi:hypothetical protein